MSVGGYMNAAELIEDYRNGFVNNGDNILFCGQPAEVIGMFHRDGTDKMYLGLLLTESGIKTEVVVD